MKTEVTRGKKDETHHEVEAKGVEEPSCAVCLFDTRYDFKPAWRENDCEANPETAIG